MSPTRTPQSVQWAQTTFGPERGTLNHDPNDEFVPTFDSGVDITNFVAEANFIAVGSTWSNGLIVRRTSRKQSHVIVIEESGIWFHYLRSGDPEDDKLLQSGSFSDLQKDVRLENHVRVIAQGERGWLFINGGYEAELDLSGLIESGAVKLLGAWFDGDEHQGQSTRYYGFTVRPVETNYGPTDGSIQHNPDDEFIDDYETNTSLADGIIEARFHTPYSAREGDWSSGFVFRNRSSGEFYFVGVEESGEWLHRLRTGGADSTQRLARSSSKHISTEASGSNHLRVIAFGPDGWLFINGEYIAKLDLSELLVDGRVSAVGGYFTGDGVEGKSTRFEEFTLWSFGGRTVSVPTRTPTPTSAPTATPTPLITPTPTPVRAPTATATPAASEPITPTITLDPSRPIAGRDVTFTVQGLLPWQDITVEFINPLGSPAPWVTENESRFRPTNGREVTQRRLFADQTGTINFTRITALDSEGIWSVRLTGLEQPITTTYPVVDLQLQDQGSKTLGVELRSHRGRASDTFYSSGVPSALAVDVQAHLSYAIDGIEERLGVRTGRIPDIYLLWGRETLRKVKLAAVGRELGFEDGFFWSGSPNAGIYMQANDFRSDVMRLTTHEYVHLLLDEVSDGADLTAWLNEGLAEYFAFELALSGSRPDSARRAFYRSTDLVTAAADAGVLFPLSDLESQRLWNSRSDDAEIALQYSQSHMAVRYVIETYGVNSVVEVVNTLANGTRLDAAIRQVTGITYATFERRFREYTGAWKDEDREAIRQYIATLQDILERNDSIRDRRREILQMSWEQRRGPLGNAASDAQDLLNELNGVDPPADMQNLHGEALVYLGRLVDWLSLQVEYYRTRQDSKRVESNDMIPEIDARSTGVHREVNSVIYNYQLQ